MDIDIDKNGSEKPESLVDDTSEVNTIRNLSSTLQSCSSPWFVVHIETLINSRIYETGEYSDFTVIISTKIFKLHKAVICGQSASLKRAVLAGKVSYRDLICGL